MPGMILWIGLAVCITVFVLGAVLASNKLQMGLFGALAMLLLTVAQAIDVRMRISRLIGEGARVSVELQRIHEMPEPLRIEGNDVDEANLRFAEALSKFSEGSPFHSRAQSFGATGKVITGRLHGLRRETWVCVGNGVNSGSSSGEYGVAVRTSHTGFGVHVDPPFFKKKRTLSHDAAVASYDKFSSVWEVRCEFESFRSMIEPQTYELFEDELGEDLSFSSEPGTNARSLLTPRVRALIDVDRDAQPMKSFRVSKQPPHSAGSWSFGEWIIYTRAGCPAFGHLQQLGTWINEVADIFEAEQRKHAPSTNQ